MKKLLTIILTLVLLLSIVPMGAMTASAATTTVGNAIDSYVSKILGKNMGGADYTYYKNGKAYAWKCHAFVNEVWYNVFKYDIYDSACYRTASSKDFDNISTYVRNNARIGDILRFDNTANNTKYMHSLLIRSISSSGITVYEYGGARHYYSEGPVKETYTWSQLNSRWNNGSSCYYYLYKLYDYAYKVNSSSSSSTTVTIVSEPNKNTITDTNAIVWGRVDKPSSATVSKIGIKVRRDDSTYEKGWSKYETPSKTYEGYSYMEPYYNMNTELNITLSTATKYWFKFYAKVDGKEYWSPEYYITTTGTPTLTLTYNANGGYINSDKSSTYYLDSNKIIFKKENKSKYTQSWKYGTSYSNGFVDDTTLGIVKDGYTFKGWSLSKSGGTVYDKTTARKPEDFYPDIKNGSATITMYAIWVPNELTIRYNTNGGTIASDEYYAQDDLIYKKSDSKMIESIWAYNNTKEKGLYNASTFGLLREGYRFKGWQVGDAGTAVYDQDDISLRPTDFTDEILKNNCTVTLYAVWEKIKEYRYYDWTFDFDKTTDLFSGVLTGEASMGEVMKELNKGLIETKAVDENGEIEPPIAPERPGYKFVGWKTLLEPGESVEGITYNYGFVQAQYEPLSCADGEIEHTYDNDCDATCNVCNQTRTVPAHVYDNACDTACNVCDAKRSITHNYKWIIDKNANCGVNGSKHEECTVCGAKRNENTVINATGKHTYDNACDATCNVCNQTRAVPAHVYDNACDTACNVCGAKRSITHNYKWIIDKNANCGVNGSKHEECTVCGAKRNENTVINATGKHTYDNACDTTCNACNQTRTVPAHVYDNACDTTCNVCGKTRTVTHNYKWIVDKNANCGVNGSKHEECTVCGAKRNENTVISATSNHTYNNACDATCSVCSQTREVSDHTYKKYKTTDATTSKDGKEYYKCSVCGKTKTSTIYKASKVYLSTEEYTYNGSTKKPSVKVYDSKGKKLDYGDDYTYSRPSSSKKVGKYKIKVTFKGDYTGSKTLYYTINPKGTKVSSVTAAKKSLKVKISKQSSQTTGYQIQYSTSSKFKSAKTKTISSYKTTSYTIKSLSAKKYYYVRVRTYKTVDGKKYYSDWSKSVKKKTK